MNFVDELRWRGMIHDMTPGTEEQLNKEMTSGYVGIDPTADSLHIGHLVSVMILNHFQRCGHRPIVILGGATGMIGDPSGKSQERNLLTEETLRHNQQAIQQQLKKFLDFDSTEKNRALLLNNYDWLSKFSFLDFIRDIGKHLTVNYMMAKDSVKKRIAGEGDGMSFTEFSYQLAQGYDFFHLHEHFQCKLQMGGSDQWGNITTGIELIRRKTGQEAFALTCPLITKADGGKFGKTESGNVWLDPEKTSPYAFYQFWLNCSDEDSKKYIRIFSLLSKAEIETLEKEHDNAPHLRILQKELAKELTIRTHSLEDYEAAVNASEILFGKGTAQQLSKLSEKMFFSVFEGVPQIKIEKTLLEKPIAVEDFLAETTEIFPSKSEVRRMLKDNAISVNKSKIDDTYTFSHESLINQKYILIQKGKKNYYIVIVV
ncbi:MAG TPA: tyrosine--tRNA ligase [Bacteroidales bacterium]|jgi:tyrosyl-tRNA synthetase|nr:tyrosine--tRNA ligase [Bacteroidales bacterium]HQA87101.1 tyrosine--tRNA ligase [Bacteroidales bacterium]